MSLTIHPRFSSFYPVVTGHSGGMKPETLHMLDVSAAFSASESVKRRMGVSGSSLVVIPDLLARSVLRGDSETQTRQIMPNLSALPKYQFWVALDDERGDDASWYAERLQHHLIETQNLERAQLAAFQELQAHRKEHICPQQSVFVRTSGVQADGDSLSYTARIGFLNSINTFDCVV